MSGEQAHLAQSKGWGDPGGSDRCCVRGASTHLHVTYETGPQVGKNNYLTQGTGRAAAWETAELQTRAQGQGWACRPRRGPRSQRTPQCS